MPGILPVAIQERTFGFASCGNCRFSLSPFDISLQAKRRRILTKETIRMRVMVIVKANEDTEAGVMPSEQLLAEMGNYNEELVKAGIMLSGDGLHPSSKGARVQFSGTKRAVIDGPFAETKELIAGFWIWRVSSLQEAIEWAKRCPNPTGAESVLELRPVFETEDFGEEFTPELRAQEDRIRAKAEELQKNKD
jgi:hypothetical protein